LESDLRFAFKRSAIILLVIFGGRTEKSGFGRVARRLNMCLVIRSSLFLNNLVWFLHNTYDFFFFFNFSDVPLAQNRFSLSAHQKLQVRLLLTF
jgi:hypothetical protein